MHQQAGGRHNKKTLRHHGTYEVECGVLTLHFMGAGSIVLLDGAATIFSAPLLRNVRYSFHNCGIPIEVSGKARLDCEGEYTASEGFLDATIDNIHAQLQTARVDASIQQQQRKLASSNNIAAANSSMASTDAAMGGDDNYLGPRVLVVGYQNTGKSSLCRSLVNLATKQKTYGVAYVDVDVGQQCITCPGSLATAFMEAPIPVDEGFNTVMPLSFFFGDKLVTSATRKRYLDLCACTAQAAASVGFAKPHFEHGGMIINTMGWTTELGRDILLELLSIFSVTHVVVAGSDPELEAAVSNAAVGRGVCIMRYPKQTCMPVRGTSLLADARVRQLVSYFCGTPRTPLCPARGAAKTTDVFFLNALTLEPMSWQDVRPCSVGAVVWADTVDTAGDANVAGYIVLLEIGKKFFSFLAPAAGDMPKPYILVSTSISIPPSKVPPLSANN